MPGWYKSRVISAVWAPTQQRAILSRPYVAVLTPSCSIHLIMGGGWEKMPQCQWPNHWDSIITTINPSNTPISRCSLLPPPPLPLPPLAHTSRRQNLKETHNRKCYPSLSWWKITLYQHASDHTSSLLRWFLLLSLKSVNTCVKSCVQVGTTICF